MKNIIILLIVAFTGTQVYGQDKAFTVMAVQGSVSLNGKSVSLGQQLPTDAAVVLADNAYVGLLHKSGKPVEIKTKGTYNLKSYHDKFIAANKGFQEKYMDYVVAGLTEKKSQPYQKSMGVTGSVERGHLQHEIIIPLPSKTILMDKKFLITWMDNGGAPGEYSVVLKNMKEEVQFTNRTKGKSIDIDLNNINLEERQFYLLTIKDESNSRKSNTIALYIPSEDERTNLDIELSAIKGSLDLNSAIGQVAYAEICKSKKLYLDAVSAYQKASELSQGIDYYASAYNNFITSMIEEE